VRVGFVAAVVDSKFLEVRKNGERQVFVPGVAPQLESRVNVILDIHGGFLGFHEEFALPGKAEGVIGRFGTVFDLQRVLYDDLAVLRGVVVLIVHVPAKSFEKRVQELDAQLGFVILSGVVELARILKASDEVVDDGRCGHGQVLIKQNEAGRQAFPLGNNCIIPSAARGECFPAKK